MTLARDRGLTIFAAFLLTVYTVAVFVARAIPTTSAPDLVATALTLDLVVFVPAVFYLTLVRRRSWPIGTVVLVLGLNLFIASRLIPAEHRSALELATSLLPLLELALVVYVAIAVRRVFVRRRAVAAGSASGDLLERIHAGLRPVVGSGRAASAVAYELAVLHYAFLSWREPAATDGEDTFTSHRGSGHGALVGAVLVLVVAESLPIHLLLVRWSELAAWIHLALAGYSVLWLLGDLRAVARRPSRLTPTHLALRCGIRWFVDIPRDTIAGARRGVAGSSDADSLHVAPGTFTNLHLELRRPVTVTGPYGMTKEVTRLACYVDDPARLVERLTHEVEASV